MFANKDMFADDKPSDVGDARPHTAFSPPGTVMRSDSGIDRPQTGLGSAGILPSEDRKKMMMQQRARQQAIKQKRQFGGGMFVRNTLSQPGMGPGNLRSAQSPSMRRTPGVPQFSSPRTVRPPPQSRPIYRAPSPERSNEPEIPSPPTSPKSYQNNRSFMSAPTTVAEMMRQRDEEQQKKQQTSNASRYRQQMFSNRSGSGRPTSDYRMEQVESTDEDDQDTVVRKHPVSNRSLFQQRDDYEDAHQHQNQPQHESEEEEREFVEKPRTRRTYDPSPKADVGLDFSDMERFLMSPLPQEHGVLQCYIERQKKTFGLYPQFRLFTAKDDRFLLASRKRPKQKTSNYLITMDKRDLGRKSKNYLGKLRSNFFGTEFNIFDKGDSEKKSKGQARKTLGVCVYMANILGSGGPRTMKVCVPKLDSETHEPLFGSRHKDDTMIKRYHDKDFSELEYMINKSPRFDKNANAFVLNFNGRVTEASVKNFQLVTPEDDDTVLLQFGRVGKQTFTMDFRYPLSPFQAFAICLSSFDSKLACE
eukprot:TRINITY_DN7226_c0_g1_i1.p1 TRINITY_DN7226_c0_g1~~TRINITY_DN7226_c0_g1_i1.p1  ORF type:complete len:532 (-),score=166.50 TRINITY_DN7226_c0_g1_i1:232-1827(-)